MVRYNTDLGKNSRMRFQYPDGLVQDGINTIANALELLQFCSKPSIW